MLIHINNEVKNKGHSTLLIKQTNATEISMYVLCFNSTLLWQFRYRNKQKKEQKCNIVKETDLM